MALEDEAAAVLREFQMHYRRTVYGVPGYGDLHLGMDVEWRLAKRRPSMLVEEHCPSWGRDDDVRH